MGEGEEGEERVCGSGGEETFVVERGEGSEGESDGGEEVVESGGDCVGSWDGEGGGDV